MSVAILQGSSGGLGLAVTRHILQKTRLKVYALTHSSSSDKISDGLGSLVRDGRLEVLTGVDVLEESTLERAAKTVREAEGKGSVRLIACLAGILHPEKSLSSVSAQEALSTFQINTLGHLLTYKHLVPLLPTKRALAQLKEEWEANEGDPAKGLIGASNSLCFSLSARVGSIADNERGGWYSYRASKAALNQVIRTLDHELVNKSTSAVAVGYHPGTVLTSFTRPVIGDKPADPKHGVFEVDDAVSHMTKLMSRVKRDGDQVFGGRCFDWRGERVEW
ncbi:hypothetical protein BCR39DRAFT_538151 [Naematelia encephala]|uniref:Rossman fold oxidoreductase n=1 Tax=Naematelia encephala TaxID=71784 RepID=A0A1Y2AYA5_9TREE|nr:hypothetical protein BCR39DRAFT_538151 [Naematelia encephala]